MSQPSTSQSMTQMIVKSKMRYARKATPEERRLTKFAHAANVQSSDSCEEEPPVGPSGDVEKRQRNKDKRERNVAKSLQRKQIKRTHKCATKPCV